jgi:ubiquinone/menaquinone biosynthesis C-methylase UbiE
MTTKKDKMRALYNQTADHYDARYQPIQFQKYQEFLENFNKSVPYIIDAGGGSGLLLKFIDTDIILFDISIAMLLKSMKYKNCVSAIAGDCESTPFRNISTVLSTSFSVLQNLSNYKKGIAELVRISTENVILTFLTKTMSDVQIEAILSELEINYTKIDLNIEDIGYLIKL